MGNEIERTVVLNLVYPRIDSSQYNAEMTAFKEVESNSED